MDAHLDVPDCEHCNANCILQKPDYIYHKSGIDVDLEDLEEDLIASILKQKYEARYLPYYGVCLVLAINAVIRDNLNLVKDFLETE